MTSIQVGKKLFVVGARPSPLSLRQVEEFARIVRTAGKVFDYRLKTFDTTGDIDKKTPIYRVEGTDFFTDSIQKALLSCQIDIALHSAKDLPDEEPDGLSIVCVTRSIERRDALVVAESLRGKVSSIKDLPIGARIGTSSARRKEQIARFRKDLRPVDVRGNIEERIGKLYPGEMDAVIIAACALIRLGLEDIITEYLPEDSFSTHPLQGSLAAEVREQERDFWQEFFQDIDSGLRPGQLFYEKEK